MVSGDESPDWEISGDDIDIELEGYGKLQGGTLRVKGVPVLYLPYAFFPARQRRHSGFLFPTFGISDERGFIYQQPYYLGHRQA